MDVVTSEQPPAKGSALHVIALAVAKASANSTLTTFLACEASLRAATNLLRFCVLKPTAFVYLPLLTSALMVLAPLVPSFSSTWRGFMGTLAFCSIPCCAAPIGLALISAEVLPSFDLPSDMLYPALMRPARFAVPSVMLALYCGPQGLPSRVETTALVAILLLAARIVWSLVRIALLMPSTLISHAWKAVTPIDRRLSELQPGEECAVAYRGVRFTVKRLRLKRGVSALAVIHPERSDKWVLPLHGNGEFNGVHFDDSKLRLAAEIGCSVISCDYREVGASPGMLLAAADMVDDAAECIAYLYERWLPSPSSSPLPSPPRDSSPCVLILGQSMGGGVAAELAATRYPYLPCVNLRSFSSLAEVAASTVSEIAPQVVAAMEGIGLGGRPAFVRVVRLVLGLAFSNVPWRPPLESCQHWRRLRPGKKLVIYHPEDHVIGHDAALHTALEQQPGALEGTAVIRLGGRPNDAHNEHPGDFSPREWSEAIKWMRGALGLSVPGARDARMTSRRSRSPAT